MTDSVIQRNRSLLDKARDQLTDAENHVLRAQYTSGYSQRMRIEYAADRILEALRMLKVALKPGDNPDDG